jgi:hypothetical protein
VTKFRASIIATSALKCIAKGKDAEIAILKKIQVDEMVILILHFKRILII